MNIAPGVEMLEIEAVMAGGVPSTLFPTLIWDRENAVLVDAGLPGQLVQFRAAIERAGVPFEKLTEVIITHHDMDHLGGLRGMLAAVPHAVQVLAGEKEVPYVQAEEPPLRLAQMAAQLLHVPEERRGAMQALHDQLRAGYKALGVHVDRSLVDGETLPYGGGIQVIHTPGHTFGHICLYLPGPRLLVAGDALSVDGGQLVPAPAFTVVDAQSAARSLQKLAQYDVECVICYHGGLFAAGARQRIAALAGPQPS